MKEDISWSIAEMWCIGSYKLTFKYDVDGIYAERGVNNKLGVNSNTPNTIYSKMANTYGSLNNAPHDMATNEVIRFQEWLNNLIDINPNTPLNDLVGQINAYIP